MDKWTKEQLNEHLKINCDGYNSAVIIAALYKRIYKDFPKIGLSGFQAEAADILIMMMPEEQK